MERQNATQTRTTAPIRLSVKTKVCLDHLLEQANDKTFGRKIRGSDVIDLALTLITKNHIRKLQQDTMSNADRLELLFSEYHEQDAGLTKDDFLGQLLAGKLSQKNSSSRNKRS